MKITIKNEKFTDTTLGGMSHNTLHICTKIVETKFAKVKVGDILYYTDKITPSSIINLSNNGSIIINGDFTKAYCRPLTKEEPVTITND